MSVSVVYDGETLSEVQLHHLPCKIDSDEKANIKSYFTPKTDQVNNKTIQKASFRGFPLDGKTINVPDGYCGYIMTEKNKPFSEETNRQFFVKGKFKNMKQWYLDSQYLGSNVIDNVFGVWIDNLAQAIHQPIDSESSD